MLVVTERSNYVVKFENIPEEYRSYSCVLPIILNHTKQQYNLYVLRLS
jgi:hypothetical protein